MSSPAISVSNVIQVMELLTILTYEQNILTLVIGYLNIKSLLALERCAIQFRQMFQDYNVWQTIFETLSKATNPGYSWHRRLLDGKKPDYKKMTLRLAKLHQRWEEGPVKTTAVELKDPAVDVAMDETSIVVGFKSGDLVMVARDTLEIERTIETRLVRIRKLGLAPDFIYAGDLRNDR